MGLLSRIYAQTKESSSSPASQQSSTQNPYDDDSNRLMRKAKENPFFPIALVACAGTAVYGFYKLKYRNKDLPLNLHIIQIRVAAQGLAIGTLTIGMTYMLCKRLYHKYYKGDYKYEDYNYGR